MSRPRPTDEDSASSSALTLLDGIARPRHPLLAVAVLTLLAKGGALLPGFAIDDWTAMANGRTGLLYDVWSKARWGHWLMLKAAQALQIEFTDARILWVSAAIVSYALLGWAVVRFWGYADRGWLAVLAAAMIANHPYTSEIFSFRIGLPPAAAVAALLALMLHLAAKPSPGAWAGSFLFAFSLSCYPIALHYALMIALVGAALLLGRWLIAGRDEPVALPKEPLRAILQFALFIFAGTLLYCLIGAVAGKLLHVQSDYFTLLGPAQIPARFVVVIEKISSTFLRSNPLIPPPVRALLGLVVLVLVAGLVRTAPWRAKRAGIAAGMLALLGAALMWSVGVYLVRAEWWPVPRSMAHIGVFWAGCCLLAAELMPRRWAYRAVVALAALIVLSFVGVNQQVFEDQRRLNARDVLMANRILARLEALPGFEHTTQVAFVGSRFSYPEGPLATTWGDLNISAFGAFWSQTSLVREASGLNLQRPYDPARRAAAVTYCSGAAPWPASEAVALRDGLAIVCLEKPAAE